VSGVEGRVTLQDLVPTPRRRFGKRAPLADNQAKSAVRKTGG